MAQVFTQALGGDPGGYVDPYAAAIEEARKRIAQPVAPMHSPEEIAQRRATNQRQYQLGILGQLTGDEGLANVGGMVFRQALAQRTPTISERGTADPLSGEFTYNPQYLREREEAGLSGLETKSAQARATWDAARQRAEERAQERANAAADRRELRAITAAAAGNARQQVQDTRIWGVEDRMADDFRKETGKDQGVISANKAMQATAARTDAASDVSLIFQFMKALDPGSTVREGEAAMAQNAAGVPDRVRNLYNNILTGQRLNPQQRKEFLGVAGRLAAQAEANINETAGRYRDTATRRPGVNVDAIVGPYGRPAAAPSASGGGKLSPQEQAELEALRKRFPR